MSSELEVPVYGGVYVSELASSPPFRGSFNPLCSLSLCLQNLPTGQCGTVGLAEHFAMISKLVVVSQSSAVVSFPGEFLGGAPP